MTSPPHTPAAALAGQQDPRSLELQLRLAAGPLWFKLAAIVLGVLSFILLAARVQFGVVLGLELNGPLLVMPVLVGLVLGALLASAWHFYRRATTSAQLLALEQTRNEDILAGLEQLVDTRSAQLRATEAQMLEQHTFAALGRMSAGIAHDFNNLLTTIALGAHELGEPSLEPCERAALVEALSQACERGSGITRQLQASSAAQLHRPERVDLCGFMRGDLGVWRTLASSGIELHSEIPDTPLPVRIDPAQFHRVILNLVVNACQAMGESGRLSLCVGAVPRTDEVFVSVSDTAGGIPPAVAERIFEPFFTTRETGTGLGLAVVRGVVTQAKGRVELEPVEGGTCFRVVLPAAGEDASASMSHMSRQRLSKQHLRVALVDTDTSIREVVVRALQRLGHEVEAFAEPAALLAKPGRYDLLITDLALPGLSGPELALGLREAERVEQVMFMSGAIVEHVEHVEQGVAQIPDAILLRKPFRAAELHAALEAVTS